MLTTDRFEPLQLHNQTLFQPECPVYVHCYRRCVEQRSGVTFLQVRMVNRSERCIKSVILAVQSECGDVVLFRRGELFLSDCNAFPGAIFGEERMLSLGKCEVPSLYVTVERVIFEDGMIWRRLSGHRLQTLAETGWERCGCGMPNSPKAQVCVLCGKALAQTPAEVVNEQAEEVTGEQADEAYSATNSAEPVFATVGAMPTEAERPAPILRTPSYSFPQADEEYDDEEPRRRWPSVLLCAVCIVALLMALAFLVYCLSDYMGWELFNF